MGKVFVSHVRQDQKKVGAVLKELVRRRLINQSDRTNTFEPIPGSDIRGDLKQAIRDSSSMVVLWSEAAHQSAWVNYEMGLADALGIPIVAVNVDGGKQPPPAELSDVRLIDLDAEAGLARP